MTLENINELKKKIEILAAEIEKKTEEVRQKTAEINKIRKKPALGFFRSRFK